MTPREPLSVFTKYKPNFDSDNLVEILGKVDPSEGDSKWKLNDQLDGRREHFPVTRE
jgi:hypothetical protein